MKSILMKARVVFVIEGCHACKQYKKFVEELNLNLPIEKQIRVIYCDEYYDYGIVLDPLIRTFKKYLPGTFPVLFFEGTVLYGAVDKDILKYAVKTLVMDDMLIPEDNPYVFDMDCKIIEGKLFGRKIACE